MNKIHLLPDEVISKIAAGQVVERPAYAIKELVENSIDAKADLIEIKIQSGGLEKIVVTDNGMGMNKEDLKICFKKHTTSKIHTVDDLHNISSMGFRGEALSSICSVGKTTISSRAQHSNMGNTVVIDKGEVKKISPIGMPRGTRIQVDKLFSSLPAQYKFLKSELIELRYVTDVVIKLALIYPHIRFTYSHNGNTILDMYKSNRFERVQSLFGEDLTKHLIPVELKGEHISINGYIAHPQLSTENTNKQYLYINNRFVRHKNTSKIIREAYGALLSPVTQPIFILFIEVPYGMVDVNVHPRKEEINFYNEEHVLQSIKKLVTQVMQKSNLAFFDARWQGYEEPGVMWQVRDGGTKTYAAKILRDTVIGNKKKKSITNVHQLHNMYLFFETNEGVMLIDQHAAHERILYEQFKHAFYNEKERSIQYVLPRPILINLPIDETYILKENQSLLSDFGITIDSLGTNTYKITTVPMLFKDRDIAELIKEMISDLTQHQKLKSLDTRSDRMLAYLACRNAVKAGDILTQEKMQEIVLQLNKTQDSFTCPHGRPTQFKISLSQLNKIFKRK